MLVRLVKNIGGIIKTVRYPPKHIYTIQAMFSNDNKLNHTHPEDK
jgi:hypothetical protein